MLPSSRRCAAYLPCAVAAAVAPTRPLLAPSSSSAARKAAQDAPPPARARRDAGAAGSKSLDNAAPQGTAHESVFVSNARRSFESMMFSSPSLTARRDDDDENGKGAVDEDGGAVVARASALQGDFDALGSAEEPPLEESCDPTTAPSAVAEDREVNVTDGEGEHAFIARCALEAGEEGGGGAGTDYDAGGDADAPEEAAAAPPSVAPRGRARSYTTNFTEGLVDVVADPEPIAAAGKVDFFAAYAPISTAGGRYTGAIAEQLTEAAWERGFQSPVWGTVDALFKHDLSVPTARDGDGDDGVCITSLQRPVTLYNLEQTSLSRTTARAMTPRELQRRTRPTQPRPLSATDRWRPRDITGRFLFHTTAASVASHPAFHELQRRCPLWISDRELTVTGARVKEAELQSFAMHTPFADDGGGGGSGEGGAATSPATKGSSDSTTLRRSGHAARRMAYLRENPVAEQAVRRFSDKLGVDLVEHCVYFNVHQLEDAGRFLLTPTWQDTAAAAGGEAADAEDHHQQRQEEEENREEEEENRLYPSHDLYDTRFIRCYSVHGRQYSSAMTFLMREYCKRSGLPADGTHVWVSEHALAREGGVPTRSRLKTAEEGGDREEVPPPFSVALEDGVLTLHNAALTTAEERLFAIMKANQERRVDYWRGTRGEAAHSGDEN